MDEVARGTNVLRADYPYQGAEWEALRKSPRGGLMLKGIRHHLTKNKSIRLLSSDADAVASTTLAGPGAMLPGV